MAATMAGLAVSAAAMAGCSARDSGDTTSPSASRPGVSASRPPQNQDTAYTDGRYSATGFYGSLPSSIAVTVTLDDDVITGVQVTRHATDPTSLDYQRRFAAAVPAVVVGKDIDEVHVDRLAGASGTSDGFNAALEQIKAQASK